MCPAPKPETPTNIVIQCNGNSGDFIDPRGLQLTDYTPAASSVIVDMRSHVVAPFTEPALRSLIIYEMHIGSFNQDPAVPGRYNSPVRRRNSTIYRSSELT